MLKVSVTLSDFLLNHILIAESGTIECLWKLDMGSSLQYKIHCRQASFLDASHDPSYVTITRSNGYETFAIVNQKLKYINLNSKATLTERHNEETEISEIQIPFQPEFLIFNGKEDLLCAFTSTQIMVATIATDAGSIKYTRFIPLQLDLKPDQQLIQCLFNNISLNCAELVILTTTSLLVYDLNKNCNAPVKTLNFKTDDVETGDESQFDDESQQDNTQGEFFGFNEFTEPVIYDPVSISFGSNQLGDRLNPKGDLTLFILTSDCSLYRLYPFLPDTLQVSSQWIENLFEYSTLQYNLIDKEYIDQPDLITLQKQKYAPMLKLSTLLNLEVNNELIDLRKSLPNNLLKPQITGPLLITPFHDSIYDQACRKLLVLKNDILVIVLEKSIMILYDYSHPPMAFKDIYIDAQVYLNGDDEEGEERYSELDAAKLLDNVAAIQYNLLKDEIVESMITPNSSNQSLILLSNTLELVHLDFTQWINKLLDLSIEDMSDLIEILNNGDLPTITRLVHPFAQDRVNQSSNNLVNKLYINWQDQQTFATIPIDDHSVSCFEISIANLNRLDTERKLRSLESEETEAVDGFVSNADSLLTSSNQELFDLLNATRGLVSNINSEIVKVTGNEDLRKELDDEHVNIDVLKATKIVIEKSSVALVNLFKVYGLMNNRVGLQKNEFQNQINSLVDLMASFDKLSAHTSPRLESIVKNQLELSTRASNLHEQITSQIDSLVEDIDKAKDLSQQETKLLREFEELKQVTIAKQKKLEQLSSNIKLLKDMDGTKVLNKVRAGSESLDFDFDFNTKVITKQLVSRKAIIESLIHKLNDIKLID